MELFPVPDVPETREDDDLVILVSERVDLRPDDMICVASAVISKAGRRFADLGDFPVGPQARELAAHLAELTSDEKGPRFTQAVLEESIDLVTSEPSLLTETRFGHVSVNAGIDRSSVPDHDLLLLPKHPSESTEYIRADVDAGRVVVTDTCGRPFRHGQRGVVIDRMGLSASHDWRGEADHDGHELGITVESVVDELAAAVNPMWGEDDGSTPVVVVRGFEWGGHGGNGTHFRDIDDDSVRQALHEWHYDL